MISGRKKTKLTIDAVLDRVSEYDIFRWYMSDKSWKINQVTYSPFRQEQNPSFLIGNKHGRLSFIDFADTSRRGDCFTFVKLLYNLYSIDDVLKMIDRDFNMGIANGAPTQEYKKIVSEYKQPEDLGKRYSMIQVKTRKFTIEELDYWNLYHQDVQDLRDNNIYSIDKVFLNKSRFSIKDNELRFGYFYDGHWKIYRPFADKKNKWMPNNVPITMMDSMKDVECCSLAFINKSKKDYMVMKKLYPHCCAVQNEGMGCFSPENVQYLKDNSDIQILSFDADVTGVQNSQQVTKLFDFGYCNVPRKFLVEGIKDWADLSREYGLKIIEDYLIEKQIL